MLLTSATYEPQWPATHRDDIITPATRRNVIFLKICHGQLNALSRPCISDQRGPNRRARQSSRPLEQGRVSKEETTSPRPASKHTYPNNDTVPCFVAVSKFLELRVAVLVCHNHCACASPFACRSATGDYPVHTLVLKPFQCVGDTVACDGQARRCHGRYIQHAPVGRR